MFGRTSVTPAARLTRGLLVAVTSTFLAGASHALAGGGVPTVAAVIAMTLGTLVCVILAGRRLTLARIIVGVAISQVVFHSLFALFTGASTAPTGSMVGHGHELVLPIPSAAMTGSDYPGILMLASHLAAGLLTIALVRHGEALWWALVGVLAASLTAMIRWVGSCPFSEKLRSLPVRPATLGMHDLLHANSRRRLRGPPVNRLSFA
ncbi:hypothetical protein [Arthrobacter flavus]|uniref:Integral membrane protein n=1 Tax=Arthrobacter flavus TaxID=95172 RepID=A0ABW4Q394_9MICC